MQAPRHRSLQVDGQGQSQPRSSLQPSCENIPRPLLGHSPRWSPGQRTGGFKREQWAGLASKPARGVLEPRRGPRSPSTQHPALRAWLWP